MIKASHHPVIYPFFSWFSRWLVRRHFHRVSIQGEFCDRGRAVLVIANHISWWDGFWVMWLNMKMIKRSFYFMMLESQLRKFWFFRYAGGFSIRKKSVTVVESLQYAVDLLKNDNHLLLLFPQGQINSLYQQHHEFGKGVDRIIKQVAPDTQVIFVVNFIDYLTHKKPQLYIRFKVFEAARFYNENIENEFNRFYQQAVSMQKTTISE